jgi:hypothetical protein
MAERLVDGVDDAGRSLQAGTHQHGRQHGQPEIKQHHQVEERQIMARDPIHRPVGAADLLTTADALKMIFAAEAIQLAASIGGCADRHHQLLFVERRFQAIWTHLYDRHIVAVGFLNGGVCIDIYFHQTVWIFLLQGLQIVFGCLAGCMIAACVNGNGEHFPNLPLVSL